MKSKHPRLEPPPPAETVYQLSKQVHGHMAAITEAFIGLTTAIQRLHARVTNIEKDLDIAVHNTKVAAEMSKDTCTLVKANENLSFNFTEH